MVAIRLIISVACAAMIVGIGCVVASGGCGSRVAVDGDWIGSRGIVVPKGQETPADTTLNRIELKIRDERFSLVSLSEPFEGPLDVYAKTQQLHIDKVMGLPAQRAGPLPTFTLTWVGNGDVEIKDDKGLDIVLRPKHETPPAP